MLPTKGYFQDIECPYFNSSCGRPYCHFRHRKKPSEHVEEVVATAESKETSVVPTYKPTPKSQLANIHNNRSHIPISYVPDLAFRPDKRIRPTSKTENPTYKPTPLSILSSANNRNQPLSEEHKEHIEVINEIKQNIASIEYDPTTSLQTIEGSDIDFENLSNEFDLIDEIINEKSSKLNSENTSSLENSDSNHTIQEEKITQGVKKQISVDNQNDQKLKSDSKKTIVNEKNHKTEKSSKEIKEVENNVKNETESISISEKSNNNLNNDDPEKREFSHHKKHKKEKSKSPNREINKNKEKNKNNKEKCISKEKESEKSKKDNKGKDKEHGEKSKKEKKESKDTHSSKHKDKEKEKQKDKEKNKTISTKLKEEKRQSDDKSDYKKNTEKEKLKSKARSPSISREHKSSLSSKKEKINDKRSRSRSKEHKSNKREKTSKERSRSRSKEHKAKSKDRSRSRSKERKKNKKEKTSRERSKSKERRSSKDEDKKKKHNKDKLKKEKEKLKHNKSEGSDKLKTSNNVDMMALSDQECELDIDSDIDLNISEDETMLECYKIFSEYKPEESLPIPQNPQESEPTPKVESEDSYYQGKKRKAHASFETLFGSPKVPSIKPKTIQTPGQILANRYKLAKQAQANREQELLMNELQQSVAPKRRPSTLLEAARERKKMREMEKPKTSNLIDDIIKGSQTVTYTPTPKVVPKKIAPVYNVMAITKAKERISKIQPVAPVKTVAQIQKGNRVAHVPDISLSDIPDVLQSDRSKLPVNVRTRFLTMIADECVKMYISKEEAFSRALKEEFSCYEKCKVLTSYRNSAMLAVNRLRKEIQERNKNGMGLIGIGEDMGESSDKFLSQFYNKIKKWVLTDEELDIHGYPRQTEEYGVAIVKNFQSKLPSNLDENQRICSRCRKLYHVDDDGWPLFEEECCYHPLKKRTIRGEQTYLCCRSNDDSGCATSDTHVYDGFVSARLEGFQTTMDSEIEDDSRNYAVYALDCEMCYTTKGLELTRVTIVDTECKTIYESLVKPLNPIIDYNTRFSGITKEQMDKTSTSILQVQANILHLCNSMTILVGHSLESDMKALKIVHGMVIDTSVLFPHKMGLPHKRALRVLASEYLRKIIQNDVSGHDSAEDAVTCMELLKWKLKEESKGKH